MIDTECTFQWDTELSADSVEWWPNPAEFQDFLAVGTYQVDKSDDEKFSADQRRGRLTLHQYDSGNKSLKACSITIDWLCDRYSQKFYFDRLYKALILQLFLI